jgi:O-antigen/teichoic acid export membrane protein
MGKENLVTGAAWSVGARVANVLVRAGAVVLLVRLLTPSDFGTVTYMLSVASLLMLVVDFGISASTARMLADEEYPRQQTLVVAVSILAALFGIVAFGAFQTAGIAQELLNAPQLLALRDVLVVLLIARVLRRFLKKCFEGIRRVDLSSKVSLLVEWMPWGISIIGLLLWRRTAEVALLGNAAGTGVVVLALGVVLWRVLKLRHTVTLPSREQVRSLVAYALPLMATSASMYVYTESDILLVQYFLGERSVGIYGVVVRLVRTLHVPAIAIGSAAAGYFARARLSDDQRYDLFVYATQGVVALYLPLSAGLVLTADELLPSVFGNEYGEASFSAQIYALYLFMNAISALHSLALDYMGFARRRAVAALLSAAANIALNIVLIPRFGIEGAALATQITYTPLALWYVSVILNSVGGSKTFFLRKMGAVLLSTTGMVFTILLFKEYVFSTVLFVIPVGAVSYISFGYVLGIFSGNLYKYITGEKEWVG